MQFVQWNVTGGKKSQGHLINFESVSGTSLSWFETRKDLYNNLALTSCFKCPLS